nr:hypothetical protein [uncultured bacterium]
MTTWRVVIEKDPETGEYGVWCPELPGCISAGDTEEQAMENIKQAITLYLEPTPIEITADRAIRQVAV